MSLRVLQKWLITGELEEGAVGSGGGEYSRQSGGAIKGNREPEHHKKWSNTARLLDYDCSLSHPLARSTTSQFRSI